MKKELLILDCFGVICDPLSLPTLSAFYGGKAKEIWAEYGPKVDLGELSIEAAFTDIAKRYGGDLALIRECFVSHIHVKEEMKAFLAANRAHYDYALLSNAPKGFLERLFEDEGIAKLFHPMLISANLGLAKPDPRIYEEACKRIDIPSYEKAYFVDDSQLNIAALAGFPIEGYVFTDFVSFQERFGK